MYSESRPPADATSNDMTFLPITNLIRSLPAPARPPLYPSLRPFDPLSWMEVPF